MAILVIEIETITDYKGVRDGKPTVVGHDGHSLTTNLAKQDGCAYRSGTAVREVLDKSALGLSRVEDIIEEEHVASGDIGGKRFIDY